MSPSHLFLGGPGAFPPLFPNWASLPSPNGHGRWATTLLEDRRSDSSRVRNHTQERASPQEAALNLLALTSQDVSQLKPSAPLPPTP